MSAKIVSLVPSWRPKTFTSAEAMLDEVREILHADSRGAVSRLQLVWV